MSQITLLYKLQQLDNVIREKKQRLTKVMQEMNQPEALLQARELVDTTSKALGILQTKQRDLELQEGSLLEKYQTSHDRMYSGKVTNSRELSDLQMEVDSLQGRRNTLDDKLLDNMVAVEEKTEQLNSAETTLTDLDSYWQKKHATLNDEKLDLATELGKLLGERKAHAAKIETKHLITYADITKKRRGLAVVELKYGQCDGCQTRVAVSIAKSVSEGQITYCGTCGRILTLPVSSY